MTELTTQEQPAPKRSLIAKFAERFHVEPTRLMGTLKATAFKSEKAVSDEQMMALLIVADQYSLNPFTKEIYAFPDKGGIVPVVSVDGWSRIINENPMMDGVSFAYDYSEDGDVACTCTIFRKDRTHPITVTEYMRECKRGTQPWNSHPRRMLRHKALIQCSRLAFGFAGIFDEDEAQRIVQMGAADEVIPGPPSASAQRVAQVLKKAPMPAGDIVENEAHAVIFNLQKFAADITNCTSEDVAALILDTSREYLTEEEQLQLAEIYRGKFN